MQHSNGRELTAQVDSSASQSPLAYRCRPNVVALPVQPVRHGAIAYLLVALVLLCPGACFAYIDPNAAGYLFQILFPVIAAIGGAWVFLRRKITAFMHWLVGLIGRR